MKEKEKLYDIHDLFEKRFAEAFSKDDRYIEFYFKLYKATDFIKNNKLDMFKYGEYINSITEDEIDRMSEEEITKYFKAVEFIKGKDLEFFNRLSIAADENLKDKK